jgi:hypothetical protein
MGNPALRDSEEFKRGRNGEHIVASVLMRRGYFVVPSYDYSGEDNNKAPRMEGTGVFLVIPDLDVCKHGERKWIEVKTKKKATLHRGTGVVEHGFSLRHYRHYQRVEAETGTPVGICIVEEDTGLILGARIRDLAAVERIYCGKNMGRDGMVFFPRSAFRPFARIEAP